MRPGGTLKILTGVFYFNFVEEILLPYPCDIDSDNLTAVNSINDVKLKQQF